MSLHVKVKTKSETIYQYNQQMPIIQNIIFHIKTLHLSIMEF